MTASAARRFIREVREDAGLRDRVRALGADPALADIVAVGAAAELAFDVETLRQAWRQDWALRWLAVSANGSATGNRASSTRARPE